MSVTEWDQWKEDNPDWTRDYSDPSTMPGVGEVGEWKDKLRMKHPGWNDVLNKVGKTGSNVKKTVMPRRKKNLNQSVLDTQQTNEKKKPVNNDYLVRY